MEVNFVPQKADYKNIQNLINSSSNLRQINNSSSAGKSNETESKAHVAETAHLGQSVDTYV